MLQPDITVLYQVVLFLVAIFIIQTLILKPYSGSHIGREKRVAETRATAQREDELAAEQRSAYENRINQAREKAEEKRQQIRGAAQEHEHKVLSEALEASERRVGEARRELGESVTSARIALAAEAKVLAREMAARALGRAP